MVDVLLIIWCTVLSLWWLAYRWYFDIMLSIFIIDVLSILWYTWYFGHIYTVCTAHTRYLRVSILPNSRFFHIGYWLYCIRKVRKQQQTTSMSTYWCLFPPTRYCFFSFCLLLSSWQYVSFSGLGHFLSVSSGWHPNARCRSHSLSFLFDIFPFFFLSSFSLFFYVTSKLAELVY